MQFSEALFKYFQIENNLNSIFVGYFNVTLMLQYVTFSWNKAFLIATFMAVN